MIDSKIKTCIRPIPNRVMHIIIIFFLQSELLTMRIVTFSLQVVESHQLDDLDSGIILKLLKFSCVEHTVPDVCSFYNTKGCRNEKTCTFLHVCL